MGLGHSEVRTLKTVPEFLLPVLRSQAVDFVAWRLFASLFFLPVTMDSNPNPALVLHCCNWFLFIVSKEPKLYISLHCYTGILCFVLFLNTNFYNHLLKSIPSAFLHTIMNVSRYCIIY